MKERKLNNKGFSLVELIIVIAIMVILVVVFAPQYLRFVNNSRISTDVQTAGNMVTAIEASIAEGNHPFGSNAELTGTTYPAGVATISSTTGWPASRLNGTWHIYGTDTAGVTRVTLGVGTQEYQAYPDNESADTTYPGINRLNTASPAGLRQ